MRLLSKVFQPVISIPPHAVDAGSEVSCRSHRLLAECGLIRATSPGLFALLPLGRRALAKLEAVVAAALDAAGAQRMSLPVLAETRLWQRSGRLQEAGPELLQLKDRQHKPYLLAPTHEEGLAALLAETGPLPHRRLPLLLYQIGDKFRDEARPKHGLLRARQFRMMDAYGVHEDSTCAARMYADLADAYHNIFKTLALTVHRVPADGSAMGAPGSESHEWQLPAAAGEDGLAICQSCSHAGLRPRESGTETCARCGADTITHNSIEVGHTFMLGSKYAAALGASVVPASGVARPLLMTCYGVGTTRLLAAALEATSEASALRWPRAIAPYHTLIIPPKEGSVEAGAAGGGRADVEALYAAVSATRDVIVDDRTHLTVGKRLRAAQKMGYPHVVVMGRECVARPPLPARYELHSHLAAPPPAPAPSPLLLSLEEVAQVYADKTPLRHVAAV